MDDKTKEKLYFGFPFYPKQRDEKPLAKVTDWLNMKRQLDDVHFSPCHDDINDSREPRKYLWRIHDKLYDLSEFNHPGGQTFLEISRDTDITELFETSHYDIHKARAVLDKFFVRDCHPSHKRYSSFFTFHKNGFYDRLRSKVNSLIQEKQLVKLDQKNYVWSSRFYHDMLLVTHLSLMLISIIITSFSHALAVSAGIVLGLLQVCAHNFFHKNDNWRMYSFDLTMTSSYEWRISHAYSHHNYANTILDYEIQAFEPLVMYLPFSVKNTWIYKIGSTIAFLVVVPFVSTIQLISRIVSIIQGRMLIRWEFFLPMMYFALLVLLRLAVVEGIMNIFTSATMLAAKVVLPIFFIMQLSTCSVFILSGLIGVHHHPNVWHAGDDAPTSKDINTSSAAKALDFGIYQLIAVGHNIDIDRSDFWTLVRYGRHALHHMFPTIDHVLLPHFEEALVDTCREFNILDLAVVEDIRQPKSVWAQSRCLTIFQSVIGLIQMVQKSNSASTTFPFHLFLCHPQTKVATSK